MRRLRHGGARLVTPVELDWLAAALEPALAEASLVNGIAMAARTDWRAAAFILSGRWPQRWALPDEAREPHAADLDAL